jgi:hypothetical protein
MMGLLYRKHNPPPPLPTIISGLASGSWRQGCRSGRIRTFLLDPDPEF